MALGEIGPIGIYGYSAKVEFCKDGSGKNVQVAFSTDKLIKTDKLINKEPKSQEVPREGVRKIPELEKIIPDIESKKENP